jgi:hypothetical protein
MNPPLFSPIDQVGLNFIGPPSFGRARPKHRNVTAPTATNPVRIFWLWCPALLLMACSSQRIERGQTAPSAVAAEQPAVPAPPAVNASTPAGAEPSGEDGPAEHAASGGENYASDARALFRAAACGTSGELPRSVDRGLVERHCGTLRFIYDQYRKRWLSKAIPFMAALRPPGIPRRIVYPFGGGDLFAALAVFPDAEEITTISHEPAGDVRSIETVTTPRLRDALAMNRRHLKKLLGLTYSKTTNLDLEGRGSLPGEVVFLMAALAVHGLEPIALRYFEIREDGALHYFDKDELGAVYQRLPGHAPCAHLSNVEIEYAKAGSSDKLGVIRHIAQDLSDKALQSNAGLLRHLAEKGSVSAMTKAASHLLWADEFSMIRNYLLKNAEWMISDSTGIPPRFASAAGFVQDTWGKFDGPARYGPIEPRDAHDFRKLFAENPKRDLGFQFGYADVHRQIHLVVTRRADAT